MKTIGRRTFIQTTVQASTASILSASYVNAKPNDEAALAPVRVGVVGVGNRGTGLLKILLRIPGTKVPAICDINPEHLNRGIGIVKQEHGTTPEGYSEGPYHYRTMLERDDLDAILIATPAPLHAEMAVDTMNAGKHAGSEVPGAYTLEECWNLVKTKEATGKRYMLLENYNYTRDRMMIYEMVRAGVFGDPHYAECAYIHDCRSLRFNQDGTLTWRGDIKTENFGNLYPTHSLGPVSKWLGIHEGDRMVSLTSRMSRPGSIHEYAVSRFGKDSQAAKIDFVNGDMCVTLIKTAADRLITVYYDSDSPRPMSNFYLVQGPKGVYDSREGIHIDGQSPAHQWEPIGNYRDQYEHEYWRTRADEANRTGHGGGDYFVISDFVEMARQDREPFVNVYDSATWSSIMPLSRQSIEQGGTSVEIPDFTGGRWKQT